MTATRLAKLVTAVLFALIVLAAPVPAMATPPEQTVIPFDQTYVLANCDGFDVMDQFAGEVRITEFYDRNGEVEKITYHYKASDRVYNSVTGFTVVGNAAINVTDDVDGGLLYIRGAAYNLTVPGYGIIWFDSGLGIFYAEGGIEVKFVGNYQADTAVLCDAMDQ